jgi:hypothetical protein
MEKLETLVEETLRVTNNILDKLAEDYPHAQNMLLLAKQILDYESVRELIPDIVSKESGAFDKFVALVDAEVGKFLQFGQKLPTESSPKQLEYTVCEKCNNRNAELLDTVAQLEQELALLTESNVPNIGLTFIEAQNEDLQHRLGQLERENTALQSKLERQRQAHKRRDRDLSLMSASYRHKLEHLVNKFRKLKASGTNPVYLVEALKNLQHNARLASVRIKELEQRNDLLTEECNSLHDTVDQKDKDILLLRGEYDWLASRTYKPVKENNMAKLDITMDELGAGDMAVRGVSIVIDGISAEDAARVSLRLLSAIDPMEADDSETPQHVCTCHASDEDKRPPEGKIRVMHHPGKTNGARDNDFAPMDVE